MTVKFSFLALFRRLIDRVPPLIKYWRVVVAFNLTVAAYGVSTYVIACPQFNGMKVNRTLFSPKSKLSPYTLIDSQLAVWAGVQDIKVLASFYHS